MELAILGIGVMALGAALVHYAIEARKTLLAPEAPAGRWQGPALSSAPALAANNRASAPREQFSKTDVLLADALTELLALKEQVSQLQVQVDQLTVARNRAASANRAQKPVRRRLSSGAA